MQCLYERIAKITLLVIISFNLTVSHEISTLRDMDETSCNGSRADLTSSIIITTYFIYLNELDTFQLASNGSAMFEIKTCIWIFSNERLSNTRNIIFDSFTFV